MPDNARHDVGLHISWEGEHIRSGAEGAGSDDEALNLPLRIVFASNLRVAPSPAATSYRLARNVTSGNLEALLKEWKPHVDITVPNAAGSSPASLSFTLALTAPEHLSSQNIRKQIPVVAECDVAVHALREVAEGRLDLPGFRDRLERLGVDPGQVDTLTRAITLPSRRARPAAPPTKKAGSRLDQLLDLVDLPDADSPEEAIEPLQTDDPVEHLAAAITGAPTGPRSDRQEASRLARTIEQTAKDQMQAVAEQDTFASFLRAWRSARWLLKRLPMRSGVRLDLLSAADDALIPSVGEFLRQDEDDVPVTLVVLDASFSHAHAEVERLHAIAGTASEYGTLIVAAVGPELFGASDADSVAVGEALWQRFEMAEYGAWNSLRGNEQTRHVGLFPQRLLLERLDRTEPSQLPAWGSGALGLAVCAANGFAEHGWPSRIEGAVDDLPLIESGALPTAVTPTLSFAGANLASKQGLAVWCATATPDAIRLAEPQSVWVPPSYASDATTEDYARFARLDTQLFFIRFGHLARAILADPPVIAHREEIAARLQQRFESLSGIEWVSVTLEDDVPASDDEAHVVLSCRATEQALRFPVGLGASFAVTLRWNT